MSDYALNIKMLAAADTINTALLVIEIIFILNIFAIAFMVFRERRNPQSILIWSLAFYAVPVISFVLYLFLGRGPRLTKKKKYLSKILQGKKFYTVLEKSFDEFSNAGAKLSEDTVNFIKFNTRYNCSPCCVENEVKLYTDIQQQYDDMLADCEKAQSAINVLYFIYKDSEIGRLFRDVLVRKAQEGVIVRVVVDDFGTWMAGKKFFEPIEQAGGEVVKFLSSHLKYLNRNINYRNHRKMVIIDGEVAYTGGANIGDEYANKGKIPWRDTHLRIRGDNVAALNLRFLQDYAYATDKKVDLATFAIKEHNIKSVVPMQLVASGPDIEEQNLKTTYIRLIYGAKKRVWIQTPYFIPDESFADALKVAALNGVDVRIMIPGVPDKKLVYFATKGYCAEMVKRGAKVFIHPRFLHSKTLLVDDEISSVGTFNIDIRSFKLHFEMTDFIYGEDFASQMEKVFLDDQSGCTEMDKEAVKNRTKRERFMECAMRIFSPLL